MDIETENWSGTAVPSRYTLQGARRLGVGRPSCGEWPPEPTRAQAEVGLGYGYIPHAPDWAPRSQAGAGRHPRCRDRARCDA